jgi:hypothetical protein
MQGTCLYGSVKAKRKIFIDQAQILSCISQRSAYNVSQSAEISLRRHISVGKAKLPAPAGSGNENFPAPR